MVVAIYHDPPHVLLLFLPMSAYSVIGGTYFSNHLSKNSEGPFSEGTLPCDSALSLPLAAQFDNYIYNMGHSSIRGIGQWCPTVASVEAVIVIKTCCDSILSPVSCITFRSLCLVDLSAPKGLSNTGIPMVSV